MCPQHEFHSVAAYTPPGQIRTCSEKGQKAEQGITGTKEVRMEDGPES